MSGRLIEKFKTLELRVEKYKNERDFYKKGWSALIQENKRMRKCLDLISKSVNITNNDIAVKKARANKDKYKTR